MSFIDKNLLPNEEVVYRTRLHWIIYVFPSIMMAISLILTARVYEYIHESTILLCALLMLIAIFILLFISAFIERTTSEFAVTSKRVLIKVGFIRRHSLELLLHKVEGIGVDQGIVGRLLGYGMITVSGTGGTVEPFQTIENPLEFRRQVQTLTSS